MIQNKGIEDLCNTSLGLGLGRTWMDENEAKDDCKIKKPQLHLQTPSRSFEPSLTLGLPDEADHQSSPQSDTSSFSDTRVKRQRDLGSEEMTMEERMCRRLLVCDDDEEVINARKKLRLTKEQSAFLEQSFKENSTLNPKQKLALAKNLNLRPRQVEVWFQNRRARTKLKQTEVDYEYLKKYCEALKHENKRLQKEVHELKIAPQLYMHVPAAATLTVCPSCESSKASHPVAGKPHLHKSYNQSSAAC